MLSCHPASAGVGPTTQVAMWLSFAAEGAGSGLTGLDQTHAAGLIPNPARMGSVTLTRSSATSPVFSTVNWKYTFPPTGRPTKVLHEPPAAVDTRFRREIDGLAAVTVSVSLAAFP